MYFFLLFPFSCAFFKFVFLWSYSYPGCWYLQTRWIGLKTIAHWTKQYPEQERGEAHLPPMRLSFQVHYLFYLLKFLAPENTQTTPQTHAREIWIRKMGGRKEKRGWEREWRSRTLLIRVVSVPVRQPWLIRFVRSLQGHQARIPEQGTVDSELDWCCCSECKQGWKNILTFHLLFG